ncbi:hypothetical protein GIB67_000438 [Kingdonia uniflora]|uniref:GT-1/4-like C-terminal domain-containing protein n=1 Tax=Kingdonia uniflora TaxID=39325 RepID=A0A7J7MQA8_9MAGN|nr:hypothetical protein GIB67_000438 [Kingdonia uniflora]
MSQPHSSGRSTLNLERRLDHDGHPLAITAADTVAANGVPPWNWRETPINGINRDNIQLSFPNEDMNFCWYGGVPYPLHSALFFLVIAPKIPGRFNRELPFVGRTPKCFTINSVLGPEEIYPCRVAVPKIPALLKQETHLDARGENSTSYGGRVILVKWGDFTKRIGIDGTTDAIKDAIKSAFGLRTSRAFWLEDEDEVVRSLDRDMPLGTYTLHLDDVSWQLVGSRVGNSGVKFYLLPNFLSFALKTVIWSTKTMQPTNHEFGITIKVCIYEESERITVRAEEKTFYTKEDFHDFLTHRGWNGLREYNAFRNVDTMDELRPGAMYQGVRSISGD